MVASRTRTYSPPPSSVLSPAELDRAAAWRDRWAAMVWTRVPGADPKTGEDWVLRRLEPARVPLVEIVGQHGCSGLCFLRWMLQKERIGKGDWG